MKEASQLDIPDHQHLNATTPHHEFEWTEIGTAVVTESIFGKARVRIIRQHDKARRAWLVAGLTALAVAVLAVVYWQLSSPTSEPMQSTAVQPGVSPERAAPVQQAADVPVAPTGRAQADVHGTAHMSAQPASKPVITSKPVAAKPVVTSKPVVKPRTVVTNNDAAKDRSDQQPLPRSSEPLQPSTAVSPAAEPQSTTAQHAGKDVPN